MCFKTFFGEPPIINDYFYGNQPYPEESKEPKVELNEIKSKSSGIMMEWGRHYCKLYPNFEENFHEMYDNCDDRLFHNENLVFPINNELKTIRRVKRFAK